VPQSDIPDFMDALNVRNDCEYLKSLLDNNLSAKHLRLYLALLEGKSSDKQMQGLFDHFVKCEKKKKADVKIFNLFLKVRDSGHLELYSKFRQSQLELDLLTKQEMINLLEILKPDGYKRIIDLKGFAA
jgi:hypothetical protein